MWHAIQDSTLAFLVVSVARQHARLNPDHLTNVNHSVVAFDTDDEPHAYRRPEGHGLCTFFSDARLLQDPVERRSWYVYPQVFWTILFLQVEIIANDQGNRTTPSYVAFTDTERLIGDAAKNQVAMNPSNTVFGMYDLLNSLVVTQPFLVTDVLHSCMKWIKKIFISHISCWLTLQSWYVFQFN